MVALRYYDPVNVMQQQPVRAFRQCGRDLPCGPTFGINKTNETKRLIAITRFSGFRQDLFISIKLKKV
jgi:hypothetical protein